MGRFLVVGTGPLLEEDGARFVSGQCLRTIHYVRPMRQSGHSVCLVTVPIGGTEDPSAERLVETRSYGGEFQYKALTRWEEEPVTKALRSLLEREAFDGVVGINAYPSYLVARCRPAIPFWADLNGWTMAEGQTRSAVVGHDRDLDHFWRLEVGTVLEADRFATVSTRQGDALYGELALAGRLNRHTFDWPFAEAVPNAVYPLYRNVRRMRAMPPELAGLVPADAHLVLWCGGFNTWTDVELLAGGLERAMGQERAIHFVATGGSISGHDEKTFEAFRTLAEQSLPPDRVHLLGWVETRKVVALHGRADVGLNIDGRNTETRFGARNRLTNMMGAGVPVLTTEGTEIAEWIASEQAGEVVPQKNVDQLANALLRSLRERDSWARRAERAREKANETFAPENTLRGFLEWCDEPLRAPDKGSGGEECEAALWARLKLDEQVQPLLIDRASLVNLRRKWPIRLWRWMKSKGRAG